MFDKISHFLPFFCFASIVLGQFSDWKPEASKGFTYCGQLKGAGISGGIVCGNSSYFKMKAADPTVSVVSPEGTLGLLNIRWISTNAYTAQKPFYTTCRKYFLRLYDNFYTDVNEPQCAYTVPMQAAFNCTAGENLKTRKGSGYCLTEPVCGATVPIHFLKTVDSIPERSVFWVWGNASTTALLTTGNFEPIMKCYGYSLETSSKDESKIVSTSP